MRRVFITILLLVAACQCVEAKKPAHNDSKVKNIIYMIGDGMGLCHVSMLQVEGKYAPTAFDRAHNIALLKTYSANNRVTDSAAAGTALATGFKTDNGTLGQLPDGTPVESIMAKAQKKGYATGLVVTCYLQHATPAAFYAHVKGRGDSDQISRDFMQSGVDVAFGGGKELFEEAYEDSDENYADLLKEKGYEVIYDQADMEGIHSGRVVGLFAEENLPELKDGRGDYLARATDKALEILTANVKADKKDGFVIMVEGSQIDYRSHANDVEGILAEMRDFEKAVKVAMDYADAHEDTLVVICADHETSGMTIPSNKTDFTLPESGINYDFSTTGHTGVMVPVYLYGACAERINGIMENTELSQKLQQLIGVADKADK